MTSSGPIHPKDICHSHSIIAERLSARHPNSASLSRFVMCQSRFRNSIIVTLRNSGRSVEESVRARTLYSDNPPPGVGEDTKAVA